jgi:hypothetical protein
MNELYELQRLAGAVAGEWTDNPTLGRVFSTEPNVPPRAVIRALGRGHERQRMLNYLISQEPVSVLKRLEQQLDACKADIVLLAESTIDSHLDPDLSSRVRSNLERRYPPEEQNDV